MTHRNFVAALATATVLSGVGGAVYAQSAPPGPPKREFITGQAGTLPRDPRDLARTYFQRPEVRQLIYALESAPLTERAAEGLLARGETHLNDLLRVQLVRNENGQVHLAFAYFTASDMRRIHAVASRFVPSLIAAYRTHWAALAAAWDRYPIRSVARDQMAFTLVVGVGLNWDGLDILTLHDWRKPVLVSGPGWRYSFFASEALPGYSYRGYYWGSSAFPADLPNIDPPMPAAFASFGDPESDPRMNLPDLLGLPAAQMSAPVRAAAQRLGFRDDPLTGPQTLGVDTGRQIGRLLLALRSRSLTAAELQAVLPGDRVAAELDLLQGIAYLRPGSDGRFALTVPVLGDQDRARLSTVRALNKQLLTQWLERNYAPMRAQLTGLTALRQGVPYEALFTQIWHEIFGLATRELVAAHLVADPYAPTNPAAGSLAMVWKADLLQREWR
jgi:hypothetical protein